MDRSPAKLLADFQAGRISRRQMLQALGLAAAAVVPAHLLGQQVPAAGGGAAAGRAGGGGGGGGGANQAARVPVPMPFAPTGWRTTWLDKLEYECTDPEKAAAYYVAMLNWEIRSSDFTVANGRASSGNKNGKILLDMGEAMGGFEIRGGMTAPAPAAITDAGLGANRPVINARFTGFAWGIDRWDPVVVKAMLVERGLNPVEDNGPVDPATGVAAYQSFRFKDPLGFDVAVTNGNRANRRNRNANGHLTAPLPFEPTDFKTLYIDHLSFEVSDVAKEAGFYAALLGWNTPLMQPGGDVTVSMGEGGVVGGAIIRGNAAARAATAAANAARAGGAGAAGAGRAGAAGGAGANANAGRAAAPAAPPVPSVPVAIGHISFGIADWNTEKMRYEFIKRGAVYKDARTGEMEPREDFTGQLQSYHVPDAMGWDLQIGNKIGPNSYS